MSQGLRVISIGEGIPSGSWRDIFSSHRQAVNFIWQKQVISVCSRAVCPGFYRIILDTEDVGSINSISLHKGTLLIDDELCDTGKSEIYKVPQFGRALDDLHIRSRQGVHVTKDVLGCQSPHWQWQSRRNNGSKPHSQRQFGDCRPKLRQRLQTCHQALQTLQPPLSVGALLKAEPASLQSFDAALSLRYQRGWAHLHKGEYPAGILCFKGIGYGLTPGGDDFLAGYTLGFAFRQHIEKKSLSEILDLLLYQSLSENHLANTFLLQAYLLKPDRDWADFLLALENTSGNPLAAMQRISCHGASSGYDTLSGFFAAWEVI